MVTLGSLINLHFQILDDLFCLLAFALQGSSILSPTCTVMDSGTEIISGAKDSDA